MRALLIAVALVLTGAASALAAPGPETPKAFLEGLYAHYEGPDGRKAPGYDPNFCVTCKPALWFDPAMVTLLREDDRLTPKGDIGALDMDPVAMSQDPGGFIAKVEIRTQTATTAHAVVTLTYPSHVPEEPGVVVIRMSLAKVGAHWRIHDISSDDLTSLRGMLIKENAARRPRHKRR